MKLAITIAATKKYTYAMSAQARRVQCALSRCKIKDPLVILVGDASDELSAVARQYKRMLPDATVELISNGGLGDNHANYQNQAQLLIAQLRTQAFTVAREHDVDVCWSLDSDVLPQANSLRCMLDILSFDDGYYGVTTCPYPSQGGGGYLGGRGTKNHQILPDFYEEERELPAELVKELAELRAFIQKPRTSVEYDAIEQSKVESSVTRLRDLEKQVQKHAPKGNVWSLNAKQWHKRGWLDNAYPAIGLGAILPSDWCGFGCTLMSKKALELCYWDGYDGSGTEDLFICWNRWYPNGVRIAVIPHSPCDHVIRDMKIANKYILSMASHETEGECVGHLRINRRPWYSHDVGERYSKENDGVLQAADTTAAPVVDSKSESKES